MQSPDYYAALEVDKDASQDDIRKSFRKLAKKYHPDVAKDKETAETKFKEINEAYEVLGDPEKRKKYDLYGSQPEGFGSAGAAPAGAGWSGFGDPEGGTYHYTYEGTGFSDFFEQMFGARSHPGTSGADFRQTRGFGTGKRRGQDTHADILVTLHEVLKGAERRIQLQQVNRETGAAETKTHRIRIPKGISEDQLIRCAGLGQPGVHGGADGDLFLHVRFEKHPDFRVIGSDLHTELRVAPWEAVLGAEISVHTLEGRVRIKIPPHTEDGTELRIKGHGLPTGTTGEKANLFAKIRVVTPDSTTDAEKTLWQQLADSSSFNPRKF
ncbi:MAG: J domain-containing protein [Akkermansiaceae bacterium]|nr:J domain-containing protein [Akkermansiaceae bacterium]